MFCCSECGLYWQIFHVSFRRMVYSVVAGWSRLLVSISSSWLIVVFGSTLSLLIFCLLYLSIMVRGLQRCFAEAWLWALCLSECISEFLEWKCQDMCIFLKHYKWFPYGLYRWGSKLLPLWKLFFLVHFPLKMRDNLVLQVKKFNIIV